MKAKIYDTVINVKSDSSIECSMIFYKNLSLQMLLKFSMEKDFSDFSERYTQELFESVNSSLKELNDNVFCWWLDCEYMNSTYYLHIFYFPKNQINILKLIGKNKELLSNISYFIKTVEKITKLLLEQNLIKPLNHNETIQYLEDWRKKNYEI